MAQIISTTLSKKQDKVLSDQIVDYRGDTLYTVEATLQTLNGDIIGLFNDKQNKLISGTNIKTINNTSLLGSGNISITTSVPSEVAKIVDSSFNNIKIERYSSDSYGMRIQTGTVSVNKAETIHTEVKFPNSSLFSSTPVVILTPLINNTTDTRSIDTELTDVTNKGFHFSCALGNASYKITKVHYIAIQLI